MVSLETLDMLGCKLDTAYSFLLRNRVNSLLMGHELQSLVYIYGSSFENIVISELAGVMQ